MKRFRLELVLMCLFGVTATVHAQNRIGAVVGVNRTNLSYEFIDYSPRTTFGIGGVLHHRLTERLALQFQPMYLQKGAQHAVNDAELGHVVFIVKLTYIEIPALFKYSLRGKGSIQPFALV